MTGEWQSAEAVIRALRTDLHRWSRLLRSVGYVVSLVCVLLLFPHCGDSSGPGPGPGPTPIPPPIDAAVLVGAGDIAICPGGNQEATALLLDRIGGTVFTTGDNVYNGPTLENYRNCYGPSWGRHLSRTRPSPGNHDFDPPGPGTYFQYFGTSAGPSGRGFYSYNVAGWHVISLDSQSAMNPGSTQNQWLEADLSANSARCTVAYWHHPLYSTGFHGSTPAVRDLWRVLYERGVDVVLNGHDHAYERFAPQDPDGRANPTRGIRQFTVGTGGAGLYGFRAPQPNSEVRASVHGVLKLTLTATGYSWEFIPVAGQTFTDAGSGTCH